jgi:GH24 family phage-related lysozyme (muramidase)
MAWGFDFFAALRRMKAPHEVEPAPSPAAAAPETSTTAAASPAPPNTIGAQGLALIKRFEGCARPRKDGRFEAYPDPATGGAPWTIGWGATGAGIREGLIWTQAECDARLARDLERFSRDVAKAIGGAPTTQAQFDAMVSFHYNTGAIARATLTRLHKAGRFGEASAEFGKWVNAGGKVLSGLVKRRAAEAALYARGASA